jgi:hypothetical protein
MNWKAAKGSDHDLIWLSTRYLPDGTEENRAEVGRCTRRDSKGGPSERKLQALLVEPTHSVVCALTLSI